MLLTRSKDRRQLRRRGGLEFDLRVDRFDLDDFDLAESAPVHSHCVDEGGERDGDARVSRKREGKPSSSFLLETPDSQHKFSRSSP